MYHWLNFHIYYHADRDRLLSEAVAPLLADLYRGGLLRRFYFVRYSLGGPHVRLRLETSPFTASLVREMVESHLKRYFSVAPSLKPLSIEQISRTTQMLVASDPNEHDQAIYPDNCIISFAFAPEVNRYGGAELLTCSLDVFNFTSIEALRLVTRRRSQTRAQIFSSSIRALVRFSLVLAEGPEDMSAIWKQGKPAATDSRQEVQARQRLTQFLQEELQTISHEQWRRWQAAGSSLRQHLAVLPRATRISILRSHLHMFANRLDVSNAVENGLGTLLSGISEQLQAAWPVPPPMHTGADWLVQFQGNAPS